MNLKLYNPWNLAAWIWLASSLVLSAAPDWAAQQKRAEKITAQYLQKIPDVRSDRFVFKTIGLPQGGTLELDLRIDRPKEGEEPFPVVFFVHGGGWVNGSKTQFAHQAFELAQHGIAGVRLEYRWKSQGGMFTNVIEDVLGAVDFVRQRADELNLDFSRVGLAGGSAGGHLSAIAAQLTPECISYDGFNGLYDAFDRDNGRFGRGNYTGTTEAEKKQASALYLIKDNPPDTLLYHGTADTTIDIAQAYRFAEAIRAKGGRAEVLAFEGVGHSFFNKEPYLSQTTQTLLDHVSHVFGLGKTTTPKQGVKPNIIYINADDLGVMDVGFNSTRYHTPNMDRLRAEGMLFTEAYAPAANCAPSRAACMSGQYAPRTGVYTVGTSERGNARTRKLVPVRNTVFLAPDNLTIAAVLKAVGYRTIHLGKWHVSPDPLLQGFDINVGGDRSGSPTGGYFTPFKRGSMVPFNDRYPAGTHRADIFADEAIRFLKENKNEPFFMHMAYYLVHSPLQKVPGLVEKYEGVEGVNATYASMIEKMDGSIGRILDELEALGLKDSTLVLFASDNGGICKTSPQKPYRAGKGSYFEGGTRVPLVVRWPGRVEPGSVCKVPVIGIDFFPTFLEVAGVPIPGNKLLDGISLVPLLTGSGSIPDRTLFWHFPIYLQAYAGAADDSHDPLFRTRPGSTLRQGKWKLHEYFENGTIELYDLDADIGERKNIAAEHPEKTAELLARLKRWRKAMNAPVPTELNPKYDPTAKVGKKKEKRKGVKQK